MMSDGIDVFFLSYATSLVVCEYMASDELVSLMVMT